MIENLDEPSIVAEKEPKVRVKNDPRILRARGGDPNDVDENRRPTDPVGLSRSILHVLKEHEYVRVLSVGPTALASVMSAFRLASSIVLAAFSLYISSSDACARAWVYTYACVK
jgi:hypothetical protein